MHPKQKQIDNGEFPQKNRKMKFIKYGGILLIIIAVSTTAFVLNKKDKKVISAAQVTTPTVSTTEIPSWWLKDNFGTSVCESDNCKPESDPDGDKLTNAQEYYYHTNPLDKDTNKDGLTDGEDVAQGFDPSKPGKVTFDQAASDDSVVGDGLVFDKDIKQMFQEEVSTNNIKIPEPEPSLVKVSTDNSKDAIKKYLATSGAIVTKYIPGGLDLVLQSSIANQNPALINQITTNSSDAIMELSKMDVPQPAVQLHKYLLTYFELLPQVINVPSQNQIENLTDIQAGAWYDSAQAFMLLSQKIEQEKTKVSNS